MTRTSTGITAIDSNQLSVATGARRWSTIQRRGAFRPTGCLQKMFTKCYV